MARIFEMVMLAWLTLLVIACAYSYRQGGKAKGYHFRLYGGFVIAAIIAQPLGALIGNMLGFDEQLVEYGGYACMFLVASCVFPRFFRQWGSEDFSRRS